MSTAYAHTNIALVKYWGKRDRALNLPATGSLSLTIDRFGTETRVERAEADAFTLNGAVVDGADAARVFRFLDLVRDLRGTQARARVTSRNDVPTASGLASSASGFAALALAACHAFEVDLGLKELSQLARRGSGSAARSVFGGFALMHKGARADGADCYAEPLSSPLASRIALVVARCADARKHTGSTDAMDATARTSPYYPAWVATHDADLAAARDALAAGDLARLGDVMERSTTKMHASALAADPWILYLNRATVAVLDEVRALRNAGTGAWATMDAGPHVKVLCARADAEGIAARLVAVDGVRGVDVCGPGPAARIVA